MGRAYAEELRLIPRSFDFASRLDVSGYHQSLQRCAGKPLITVGSGGSFSAAELAAGLHCTYGGSVGYATTPLNLTAQLGSLRNSSVLVFTASGSNPDVVGSTLRIVENEPNHLVVVCGRIGSPLAEKLAGLECVDLIEFDAPGGKDGFLATNSLLISSILTLRAYENLAGVTRPWPATLDELLGMAYDSFEEEFAARSKPLWQRPNTLVLYGPNMKPGAADIESKFSEAALSAVQMVDLRNFAHGRHVWLARRAGDIGVLAVASEEDQRLLNATTSLIPKNIPVVPVVLSARGWRGGLVSIILAIVLAGVAGVVAGVDPGRPRVPLFGRRLYNLRAFPRRAEKRVLHPDAAAAITRKAGAPICQLAETGRLERWIDAYKMFCNRLTAAPISAVVLDYDGTLCAPRTRYEGLTEEMAEHLKRLVGCGVRIAIATGRGSSVRKDLQKIMPAKDWPSITIGYYNGSVIGTLADSSLPANGEPIECLADITSSLQRDPVVSEMATIECRESQLSLSPRRGCNRDALFAAVSQHVGSNAADGVQVVVSSHSLDILAPGVSKRRVLEAVSREGEHTLAIGDCGRWPGNDYILLSLGLSLSCLEVSPDPESCWNLAPPGCRGVQATLSYLAKLRPTRTAGTVRFRYTLREASS